MLTAEVQNTPVFSGPRSQAMDREAMTALTLQLDQAFQRGARVNRANADVRAADADARATRQTVSIDAAHAFYRVARAQVRVDVGRDIAAWLDSVVAYDRARVGEGATAELGTFIGDATPLVRVAIAHRHGAWMHTDAAQSVGKLPVDVEALGVDLLTIAGHKFYAPERIGALYLREGVPIAPVLHGASQERGIRPGTEAVAQIVALARAAELVGDGLAEEASRRRQLRDRLETGLRRAFGDEVVRRNGHPDARLPNTLNVSFRGVRPDALLTSIAADVAASAGSACHAQEVRLSPVICAMGIAPEWGMGTLRLSLGRYTTADEIDTAVQAIVAGVRIAIDAPPAMTTGHAAAHHA